MNVVKVCILIVVAILLLIITSWLIKPRPISEEMAFLKEIIYEHEQAQVQEQSVGDERVAEFAEVQ